MSEFEPAFLNLLKHEGGFVNDIDDPGGATNWGISLRYLENLVEQNTALLASFDLDDDSIISPYDIQNMTEEAAKNIYRAEWWDRYGYGMIDNQILATKVFNLAVNIGPNQAARILQEACQRMSRTREVAIDGILGPETFTFINQLQPAQLRQLIEIFLELAARYYHGIVNRRPSSKKFLNGWLNRLNDIMDV